MAMITSPRMVGGSGQGGDKCWGLHDEQVQLYHGVRSTHPTDRWEEVVGSFCTVVPRSPSPLPVFPLASASDLSSEECGDRP